MRPRFYVVFLALAIAAQPAQAQYRADARAVEFERARAPGYRESMPHKQPQTAATPIKLPAASMLREQMYAAGELRARLTDKGDLRLMFLGGMLGAAAGYLVGDAAHSGISAFMDTGGVSTGSYGEYLATLPAAGSAMGAAMGANAASCVKFLFGSLYRLDSCADIRWMLLGALPGAALGYAFRDEGAAVTAGAIVLEALGTAIAGRLARHDRESAPEW